MHPHTVIDDLLTGEAHKVKLTFESEKALSRWRFAFYRERTKVISNFEKFHLHDSLSLAKKIRTRVLKSALSITIYVPEPKSFGVKGVEIQ